MVIGDQAREATGKRAALLGALGGTAGVFLNFGGVQLLPHASLDGMSMREEGYSEANGGDGFDLQVAPYYANSLRTFLGTDLKTSFDVFGVSMTPDAEIGYRYDFVNTPVKLKAGFLSTGGLSTPGNTLTFVGPDPDTGNILAGASLSAGTDTWSSTTQVGTITLLGRI
jgi:uncharacterized protein with beta-barrel porin domain